jgi:uncharacterized protein YkwD
LLQRYRCPNCQVPVSYGQQFCDSCGVAINWQGVSPSAPFGAKDLSTGAPSPVSDLPVTPGVESSDQWKLEMQEKAKLWHKKLAYDPTYRPSTYRQERRGPRGAVVALLLLVVLLAVFIAVGIATKGTYFNVFSSSGGGAHPPAENVDTPRVVPSTPPAPPPVPQSSIDSQPAGSQVAGNPIDVYKFDQADQASVSGDKPVFNIATLEQQVHSLINEQRVLNGLQPLSWDLKLNSIAQGHSADMASRDYFNHVTPEGLTVADRYSKGGYTMTTGCGENIFLCPRAKADYYRNGVLVKTDYYQQGEMADVIVQGWMNSAGHRQNILSLNWKTQSIGIAVSADDRVYITEDFA